jgi:uncharacterized protein YjbJ (UPF0337 family)
MNKNQIEGSVKDVTGKIQQKVGHATGSTNQRVKGMAKRIEGKVQKGVGYIEQALDKARRKPRSSVAESWPKTRRSAVVVLNAELCRLPNRLPLVNVSNCTCR